MVVPRISDIDLLRHGPTDVLTGRCKVEDIHVYLKRIVLGLRLRPIVPFPALLFVEAIFIQDFVDDTLDDFWGKIGEGKGASRDANLRRPDIVS